MSFQLFISKQGEKLFVNSNYVNMRPSKHFDLLNKFFDIFRIQKNEYEKEFISIDNIEMISSKNFVIELNNACARITQGKVSLTEGNFSEELYNIPIEIQNYLNNFDCSHCMLSLLFIEFRMLLSALKHWLEYNQNIKSTPKDLFYYNSRLHRGNDDYYYQITYMELCKLLHKDAIDKTDNVQSILEIRHFMETELFQSKRYSEYFRLLENTYYEQLFRYRTTEIGTQLVLNHSKRNFLKTYSTNNFFALFWTEILWALENNHNILICPVCKKIVLLKKRRKSNEYKTEATCGDAKCYNFLYSLSTHEKRTKKAYNLKRDTCNAIDNLLKYINEVHPDILKGEFKNSSVSFNEKYRCHKGKNKNFDYFMPLIKKDAYKLLKLCEVNSLNNSKEYLRLNKLYSSI